MEKALVQIDECKLTKEELSRVEDDLLAALGLVSYAVSETNTLKRLYSSAAHNPIGEKTIDAASNITRNCILRIWSAKLFEISKFITLEGKNNRTQNERLKKLSENAKNEFKRLRDDPIFKLVKSIRDQATNHTTLREAKLNLKHMPPSADCSLYLHELGGNSFFPMGEELLFEARIRREAGTEAETHDLNELFSDWRDWNLNASDWLEKVHSDFTREIIFDAEQDIPARSKEYSVPSVMIGEIQRAKVPLFFKKPAV